jgi:hypothetical protein
VTEVAFAEAVAKKTNLPVDVVEQTLNAAGVPTTDEAATPHRLRVTRLRFEGTKAGRVTGAFSFDKSFGDGLWAICTDRNDAGKTSVLEIIMWALRGRPHRPSLPSDVESWLDAVHLEGTVDDEPFTVAWTLTDGAPFGSLSCGTETTPFTNEDAFTATMSDFMLSRLGFFEFTVWDKDEPVAHGWPSCSAALYLPRASFEAVLGDVPSGGVASRLVLMFVGARWGQTHVACSTALKQEDQRVANSTVITARIENATAGTIDARKAEMEEIRRALEALPTDMPAEAEVARASADWMTAIAEHGAAAAELEQAQREARAIRSSVIEHKKRLQDLSEASLAKRLFHGLSPTACPRCSTTIGKDRHDAEADRHTCAVCDRDLDLTVEASGGPIADADADEAFDEAVLAQVLADLERRAAEADARATELAREVADVDTRRREAAELVASYSERATPLEKRRTLEMRLATTKAIIEQLGSLAGEVRESTAGEYGDEGLKILKAAANEAQARLRAGMSEIFQTVNASIVDLGHKFGFESLQSATLDAGARMKVTKGDIDTSFSKCSPGERLRLRIAVVIALLRTAKEFNVGRHPGLLLIDSIGAEETEPGDLASFVRELAAMTEELGSETIIASARPEILKHIPKDHQLVATGDSYLW